MLTEVLAVVSDYGKCFGAKTMETKCHVTNPNPKLNESDRCTQQRVGATCARVRRDSSFSLQTTVFLTLSY